jgi:Tfp pilus assembly protein PilO
MSGRDRKILLAIVPLVLIVAYWFLLLAPKRAESQTAQKHATEQQQRLADAKAVTAAAKGAKGDFAADYGEIVRLGKAIPSRVDMPSLLVQLDRAADGTGIQFTKISQGERTALPVPAASTTPPATGSGTGSSGTPASTSTTPGTSTTPSTTAPPVAAGGTPAQSAPGGATEAANNAAATSNQTNAATDQAATDTTTSTSTGGGLPIGGGSATPGAQSAAPTSGALETVPLEMEFVGNFFNLADFFHQVKRFVHVANNSVTVNGRLITIDAVKFESEQEIFPRIKASLTATVYLSPLTQGATAGATPAGPATTPASATTPTTPPATGTTTSPAPAAPTPTAAATP